MGKQTINVEDFFTEQHESEGIWFEPKIRGEGCGMEFLVTGTGTDENVIGAERYEKAVTELDKIKDPLERVKKQKELDAKRVAEFVKGIRSADKNIDLVFEGKPVEWSVPFIQNLLLKSPLIKAEIIRFARETTNFIKREKND